MKKTFHFSLISALISLVLFSSIPTALAHESAVSYISNSMYNWSRFGSPTISSDRVLIEGSQREWVWVDIDARDIDDAYVFIAAYADKDDGRSSLSSRDKERSGNPYLYVYYMNNSGKIIKYLSGTETVSTSRPDMDYLVYGIFPTVSNTKTIRVFLKQTAVKYVSNSGANISFTRPILVEANSRSRAEQLRNAFANQSLDLTYQNSVVSTGSTPGTTGGTSGNTSLSCGGTSGTNVFKIGFESNESRDNNLQFGSSLPAWTYSAHDYPSNVSPFDRVTSSQSYIGSKALALTNLNYGYVNGQESSTPQTYDEAMRYLTTGRLDVNSQYQLSMRARLDRGSSSQDSVSLLLGQEYGANSSGSLSSSRTVSIDSNWSCVTFDFTNGYSSNTVQDLVIFFGSVPRGATLYLDEMQLIKR